MDLWGALIRQGTLQPLLNITKISMKSYEALESVMCDVTEIRLKEGLQREVGKETSR